MSNGNQILLMTIAFTWVVMVSLHFCFRTTSRIDILADAYELQDWRRVMEDHGVGKASGEAGNERNGPFLLKKFRTLLGLKSFNPKRSTKDDSKSGLSPSPSPGSDPRESPASAPDPVRRFHPRHQHSSPRSSPVQTHHNTQKQKGNVKRVLVPVIVSVAAGFAFVACVVGTACFYGKIKTQRKKISKIWLSKSKKGKKSQSSTNKVSINPTLDFLYLNTQGVDLEMQTTSSCHNQTQVNSLEREVKNQETDAVPESDNVSISSTREIVSVYEDDEQTRLDVRESEQDGDNEILHECHSSDDESFHSLVDSQSLKRSLSNISAVSINESLEIPQENELDILPFEANEQPATTASPPPLPPPPPPPPPPPTFLKPRVFPSPSFSSSSSSSSRIISNASSSPFSSRFSLSLDSISSPKPTHSPVLQEKTFHSFQDSPSYTPAPPPPPPPLMANNKTPPPPPSRFPLHPFLGKDGSSLPKLKPLHWDKVRAAPDRSMVWDKLRTSSFELDEEMIESLFLQNSMNKNEAKSKPPSPGQHLLEPKRLQNITILLKALNANAEQICNALLKGEGLCLQQLEALVKMVPTKEEEAKIYSYRGNVDELGSAEKFIKEMLGLPFAFLRAESMLFRETFEDEVVHLRNSFSMLEEACKELKSSRLFLKLLETVLKTGNRMNVGTIRGGARAFKLDALLKLSDVKGTDGKTTLLHFVVQEISRSEGVRVSDSIMGRIMNQKNRSKTVEEKEEDYRRMGLQLVSGLNTELSNVKKTATIDLDTLVNSVSNLEEGTNKLRHLLHVSLSECGNHGSFSHSMNLFLSYAENNIKKLQDDENRIMARVREVAEYFHGDVSKDEKNPLRIFVIVRDFLGMLDHVCKDLRCLRVPNSPNPFSSIPIRESKHMQIVP